MTRYAAANWSRAAAGSQVLKPSIPFLTTRCFVLALASVLQALSVQMADSCTAGEQRHLPDHRTTASRVAGLSMQEW